MKWIIFKCNLIQTKNVYANRFIKSKKMKYLLFNWIVCVFFYWSWIDNLEIINSNHKIMIPKKTSKRFINYFELNWMENAWIWRLTHTHTHKLKIINQTEVQRCIWCANCCVFLTLQKMKFVAHDWNEIKSKWEKKSTKNILSNYKFYRRGTHFHFFSFLWNSLFRSLNNIFSCFNFKCTIFAELHSRFSQ